MSESTERRVGNFVTVDALRHEIDTAIDLVLAKLEGIKTRIDAMDKANEVLAITVNRVPTDLQVALQSAHDLNVEVARGIIAQIQAVKDLAALQIDNDKQSRVTRDGNVKELLGKLEGLLNATRDGLAGQIQVQSNRLTLIEANIANSHDNRSEGRANVLAFAAVISTVMAVVGAFIGFNFGRGGSNADNNTNNSTAAIIHELQLNREVARGNKPEIVVPSSK
jgi:hypothetical protein